MCAMSIAQSPPASQLYPLVLRGGRVIDPESGLDGIRDVAIDGGKVVRISADRLRGARVVDVSGLVVAPGFIDLHAHGQHLTAQALQVMDGVTTAIDMEGGAYPVSSFLARRAGKMIINFGVSVGHRCVRKFVQIESPCIDRLAAEARANPDDDAASRLPLTDAQVAEMLRIIGAEIDSGALGIGVGIDYTPGAGRAEIYSLFKLAGERRSPVHVHVRRRATDIAPGIGIGVAQEVIANAALTRAPLQILHISSTAAPADVPVLLDMMGRAAANGLDITAEAYPYTASSTAIGSAIFDDGWRQRTGMAYGDLGWARTGERLTEESFNRYRREDPTGSVIMYSIPEATVRLAMAHPHVSIASDGMWWATGGEHPRGAGTFARVLGRYVRDQKVLDLPTAIGKMTIMPARRIAASASVMRTKGRVQEGADADLSIFDPRTIVDRATFEKPMQASVGMQHVLVNGTFVVRDGKLVPGVFPGRGVVGDGRAVPTR